VHRLPVSVVSLMSVVASSQPVSIDYDTFCAQMSRVAVMARGVQAACRAVDAPSARYTSRVASRD
jgi:hypothetical protein